MNELREIGSSLLTLATKALRSRKFMAAIVASVPFFVAHDWQEFAFVWMAYASIEGAVDFRHATPRSPKETL